jgi:general secretion pathway protein G
MTPMKKCYPVKQKGFTLVELLIVIMIIATLSGMMMLSTGSATDSAESVLVLNDLRNLKAASMMFFMDNNRWPSGSADAASLDTYMDRAFLASGNRYGELKVTTAQIGGVTRTLIGVALLTDDRHREGVRRKLRGYARNSGLFTASGNAYNDENDIYVSLR